jgi:hypothetical protein
MKGMGYRFVTNCTLDIRLRTLRYSTNTDCITHKTSLHYLCLRRAPQILAWRVPLDPHPLRADLWRASYPPNPQICGA